MLTPHTAMLARLQDGLTLLVAPNPADEQVFTVLHEVLDDTLTPTVEAPPPWFSSRRDRRARAARRHPAAPSPALVKSPPSDEDVWRSLRQLRRATYPVVDRVRERVAPPPEDTIRRVLTLCHGEPESDEALGYLRRFASTLLELADLVSPEE
ncbi:hypothetical protein ACIQHY_12600 [Streptomyces sp. NPDC092359]|uniref:hypothetical protein n=1 Tax=Streptomyces sp. NPDC092359 TaxID=3366014 RepID=UPI003816585A